jgi:hypothetical protein
MSDMVGVCVSVGQGHCSKSGLSDITLRLHRLEFVETRGAILVAIELPAFSASQTKID